MLWWGFLQNFVLCIPFSYNSGGRPSQNSSSHNLWIWFYGNCRALNRMSVKNSQCTVAVITLWTLGTSLSVTREVLLSLITSSLGKYFPLLYKIIQMGSNWIPGKIVMTDSLKKNGKASVIANKRIYMIYTGCLLKVRFSAELICGCE